METESVLIGLAALAQKSRLAVFRHLVQEGPSGACPGDIAHALGVSASTLSFHLKALGHAGLVTAEQHGRSIIYRVDFEAMQGLVDYLTENCCGGDAALCPPRCVAAAGGKAGGTGSHRKSQVVAKPATVTAGSVAGKPQARKRVDAKPGKPQGRTRRAS